MQDCELKFGWIDKNTFGLYDTETKRVKISIVLALVRIFIHEYIHELNPDATEKEIIKKTTRKLNRLTRKEIKEIGRFIWACFENELKLYIQKRRGEK